MSPQITVAVIEDHDSMRSALERLLDSAGLSAISYACADDFLGAGNYGRFDCVIVDVHLPRKDGLQLQKELKQIAPHTSLIFITGHGDLSVGMHAMRQGAVDFLEKPLDEDALLAAIHRGADLSRKQRTMHSEQIQLKERCASLTPREREVFTLITKGLLNKQAGAELGTTERTVKAHRARVMEKMEADSLADLVRMASLLGIHDAS
jgi:two-component system, LuxR family, response regulator FixJ